MTTFEEQRPKLFSIAYRMVGSAMDAEDIVQDAWLNYQRQSTAPDNPSAYLRKIVTNLSLDYLKSARVQREQYIGEWLPEPIVTDTSSPAEELSKAETISVAFLVILETLSPVERAVFILREVFDYGYDDIANILDKSEATCRKIFSRAKQHIQTNRPRFETSPETHTKIVTQFRSALNTGDLSQMTTLLADDVTLVSDGGGKVPAAIRPLQGRDIIMKFLAGLYKRANDMGVSYVIEGCILNGEQGIIGRDTKTNTPFLAATFEVNQSQIIAIRIVRNPEKLSHL